MVSARQLQHANNVCDFCAEVERWIKTNGYDGAERYAVGMAPLYGISESCAREYGHNREHFNPVAVAKRYGFPEL